MTRERPKTFVGSNDPLERISQLQPKRREICEPVKDVQSIAKEAGFTPREVPAKNVVDARSLRATNRTSQLNISVTADTKNRFWEFAFQNGHKAGEEALLALLERVSQLNPEET